MEQGIVILKKIVRTREHLIRTKKSGKPVAEVAPKLNKVKRWLEFYPNASAKGVMVFYRNHKDEIMSLIPGTGCKSRESILKELNQYFG